MNIIAGEARGRKLLSPPGLATRPILQLLKTRLFDILGDRCASARVWDLFAGTGSLGLEAVSRGAAAAVLCERDRAAFAVLEQNIAALRFGDRCRALQADSFRTSFAPHLAAPTLVFLDPPFPVVTGESERFLSWIESAIVPALAPGALVVLRTPSAHRFSRLPAGLCERDRRDHGENALLFFAAPS